MGRIRTKRNLAVSGHVLSFPGLSEDKTLTKTVRDDIKGGCCPEDFVLVMD